ncbi:hypothetical protein TRFO_13046 [Tritrichomonas foetus]|uniref:Saposin B-type domain-containing protein n=1 Tax=Tritrichomonas foetus TaxID=1144522 RepID=A0A1J4L3S8_9EUKA|nr:hypothetical protein TRFO_13046 [Tritrichomonas foetus]|eukprot:OHT16628.1 hypothetical protein TRFO_13046 [Tritrichomonas foetus]
MFAFLFALCLSAIDPTPPPFRRPFQPERVSHFECVNIVRHVEKLVQSGSGVKHIETKISEMCDRLSETRKEVCQSIAKDKIKQIVDLLNEMKAPQFICDLLGYRKILGPERQITVADCHSIVEKLKVQYKTFKPGFRRPILNQTEGSKIPPPVLPQNPAQPQNPTKPQPAAAKVLGDDDKPKEEPKPADGNSEARPLPAPIKPANDRPFGIRPESGIRDNRLQFPGMRMPFGLGPVCKELPPESRMACHIISRSVYKGLRLGKDETPEEICKNLNETRYIKLI